MVLYMMWVGCCPMLLRCKHAHGEAEGTVAQ